MKFFLGGLATVIGSTVHAAGISTNTVEEIIVFGGNNVLLGTPLTATEGIVHGPQLALRPRSRPAELLEFVPGLIATQHSGEGKGNQYFLRGFNLDHGTDLALTVDGTPVNMPSHAHGQGYADLNFLLPELVDHLAYRKGPYYAEVGNFGTAASSEFVYSDALEQGELSLSAGQFDYQRLFAAHSFDVGSGSVTLAGARLRYQGPWQLPQHLNSDTRYAKLFQEQGNSHWRASVTDYHNSWNATDQIPSRAVREGTLDRFGSLASGNGGDTYRRSLSTQWQHLNDNDALTVNAYLIDYGLSLFSNFTYFMEEPVLGDQFEQAETRRVGGMSLHYDRMLRGGTRTPRMSAGVQFRRDDSDVGLFRTRERIRHSTTREDRLVQTQGSAYVSLEIPFLARWRGVMALRADLLRAQVKAGLKANAGTTRAHLVSPKASLIYSHSPRLDIFLSAGQGFHSNDVRGTTMSLDPVSGMPVERVSPLASARSADLGLRAAVGDSAQVSASLFSMHLESELVYVGDAGSTEALGESRRHGVEISGLLSPAPWLLLDADLTWTTARLRGVGAANRIPNAVGRTASLGILLTSRQGLSGGVRVRYLGKAPLVEDNSVSSDSTLLLNAQSHYAFSPRLSLSVEILNLLNSRDNDISYFYASQRRDEVQPVEDIHFHPVEPRSLRLTLRAHF